MQILFRTLSDDLRIVAAEPVWEAFENGPFDVAAARARYGNMIERWASLHGLSVSELRPEADTEDWTENAVRLFAASDTGLPVHLVRKGADRRNSFVDRSMVGGAEWDPSAPALFAGLILRNDPLFVRYGSERTGDLPDVVWPPSRLPGSGGDYWRDPVLAKALGRRAAVSSGNPGGPKGYVATTRRLVEDGAASVRAKIVFQSKYDFPHPIVLPRTPSGRPNTGDDAIWKAYYDAFDANLLDCDGREECFLVQEDRPMTAEYRVVVADGLPVAGAGCVESLCPVFHDPVSGPFDPVVERVRNEGAMESRPDLVARYVERAKDLCAALDRSGTERFRDCTMDFALDAETDAVLLVETNPLQNFGLYAMDFGPVMEAGVRAASKAYPEPSVPSP